MTGESAEPGPVERAAGVRDAIEVMMSASAPEIVFDHLVATLAAYGFDKVVVGQAFMAADAKAADRRFFFHHGVSDFLKVYLGENYQFSDPVNLRAMTTHRPFRWRETQVDMTPRQAEQVETAQSFGLNYGMIFPVIDRSGSKGFVSIGRETDFELDDVVFVELELLCRYAYFSLDGHFKPDPDRSDISLNAREMSILMHVSRGKTNWETGQILGISEYSVRDYLKTLSKRLETSNRTHTVVRAIQLGLILP